MLLTLVTTELELPDLKEQAQIWLEQYPQLVGVCLNYNPARTNVIFGRETHTVAGRPYLREIFAGVELHIGADTFFQINTEAAELLLQTIEAKLDLQGHEVLIDAYCGIGTFTLPLASKVRQAIGIELYQASVVRAKHNAEINAIANVTFRAGAVEKILCKLEVKPDIVFLDPPRKGCAPAVIDALLTFQPSRIVYVSCQPATLARDLKLLCKSGDYQLDFVQPADFFPQTTHVECAALLSRLD
jgi:23S rRNA (uracil1939-C5)-methyltransferase